MKRIELFKRTGICITTAVLAASIAVSGSMITALAESHDDFFDPDLVESTSDDYGLEFDDYNSDDFSFDDGGEDYYGEMPDDLDLEVGGGGDSGAAAPSYQMDPTGNYYIDQYGNYYDLDWNPVAPPGSGASQADPNPETGTTDGTDSEAESDVSSSQGSTTDPSSDSSNDTSSGSSNDTSSGSSDDSSDDSSGDMNEITIVDPSTGKTYTDPINDDTAQDTGSSGTEQDQNDLRHDENYDSRHNLRYNDFRNSCDKTDRYDSRNRSWYCGRYSSRYDNIRNFGCRYFPEQLR